MIMKAYSLLDSKAGIYSTPFFVHQEIGAIRACLDLARDPGTTVGRYPGDFILYRLGEFDDVADVMLMGKPEVVGSVAALVGQNSEG